MADEAAEGAAEALEHGAAAGNACVGADGSALGMPQLCLDWFPNQIFWLIATLVVIFLILSRVALPRIGAILAERAGTITNDLAAAEDLRQKAKEAEAAYERALAEARAEASRIVAAAKAEIQAELDVELARADARIAAQTAESERAIAAIRSAAAGSVTEVARDVAGELVTALGGAADAAAVSAAVAARVGGGA